MAQIEKEIIPHKKEDGTWEYQIIYENVTTHTHICTEEDVEKDIADVQGQVVELEAKKQRLIDAREAMEKAL